MYKVQSVALFSTFADETRPYLLFGYSMSAHTLKEKAKWARQGIDGRNQMFEECAVLGIYHTSVQVRQTLTLKSPQLRANLSKNHFCFYQSHRDIKYCAIYI